MFFLSKPSRENICTILNTKFNSPYTYNEVGSTYSADCIPRGFSANRYQKLIGSGEDLFESAKEAVSSCAMYNFPFTEIHLANDSQKPQQGTVMAVVARNFGLWSVNPVRIVYKGERNEDGERLFSLAVGTLSGHEEKGEERFTIRYSKDNLVFYEIFSFYRPSRLILRLALPLVKLILMKFDHNSAEAVARYCKDRIK